MHWQDYIQAGLYIVKWDDLVHSQEGYSYSARVVCIVGGLYLQWEDCKNSGNILIQLDDSIYRWMFFCISDQFCVQREVSMYDRCFVNILEVFYYSGRIKYIAGIFYVFYDKYMYGLYILWEGCMYNQMIKQMANELYENKEVCIYIGRIICKGRFVQCIMGRFCVQSKGLQLY